ncbi:MAG: sigma-70 family RNA polymerase sigma factor [Victivallales bacterium]|nr:sigma-70 family RNA polymerase sigma factor [Victivallales bacterium]
MAFTTSKSLLSKIKAGNEIAWSDFYKTYRPLIMLCGKDFNLSDTEKEDLVQDTVLSMFKDKKFSYDPGKGKFRNYLRRVIKWRACDIIAKRSGHQTLDDERRERVSGEDEFERKWDEEWRHHLLKEALKDLRSVVEPATYQAFELFVLRGYSAAKVADILDITENTVYLAKMRSSRKLKEIVKDLDSQGGDK